jgi:hypothetical protein
MSPEIYFPQGRKLCLERQHNAMVMFITEQEIFTV